MTHKNLLTRIKGFTLIEIIVVVVIVSTMTALSLPRILIAIERFRAKEGEQILLPLLGANKRLFLETGHYSETEDLSDLDVTIPTPRNFSAPFRWFAAPNMPPSVCITRLGSYTLRLDTGGNISCSGGPAGLCTKIGY